MVSACRYCLINRLKLHKYSFEVKKSANHSKKVINFLFTTLSRHADMIQELQSFRQKVDCIK